MKPIHIAVTSDICCPWCWVGKRRLEQAIQKIKRTDPQVDIRVTYSAFMLNPHQEDKINRDLYFQQRFGMKNMADSPMTKRLVSVGKEIGIDFNFSNMEYVIPSLYAHALIRATRETLGSDAGSKVTDLVELLFKAYFSEGKDIMDFDVLSSIATEAGVSLDLVDGSMEKTLEEYISEVRKEDKQAKYQAISGVPHYVINEKVQLSGGQPAEVFEQHIRHVIEQKL